MYDESEQQIPNAHLKKKNEYEYEYVAIELRYVVL